MTAEAAKLQKRYENEVMSNAKKTIDEIIASQRKTQQDMAFRIEDNIDKANARLEFSPNVIGACLALKKVKALQIEYDHAEKLIDRLNQLHMKLKNRLIPPASISKSVENILSTEKRDISTMGYTDEELLRELKSGEITKLKEEQPHEKKPRRKLFGKKTTAEEKKKKKERSSPSKEVIDAEKDTFKERKEATHRSISIGNKLFYPQTLHQPYSKERSSSSKEVIGAEKHQPCSKERSSSSKKVIDEEKNALKGRKEARHHRSFSIGNKLVSHTLHQPYSKLSSK